MAALSQLLGFVREKAPGVIDFMMLDALKESYREFCRKSESLRQTLTIDGAAGEAVTLPLREGYLVHLIKSVTSSSGKTLDYDRATASSIVLKSACSSANVVVILIPRLDMDGENQTDDELLERYGETIAAGAARKLRLMPGETWFNPELAMMLDQEFTEGIRDAFRECEERFTVFNNRVRKREFY